VFLKADLRAAPVFDASARPVAEMLFSTKYLYVFEATSILILAALVGAIVLAKKDWTS
jgi:NADH:ubiquinone oxidoreductase subunit 6 (subunit J)